MLKAQSLGSLAAVHRGKKSDGILRAVGGGKECDKSNRQQRKSRSRL